MRPAEQLSGMTLPSGWIVESQITRKPTSTGGRFSTGYTCRNANGQRGFLKAMDYSEAFKDPTPALMLHSMTSAYLFEKRLCEKCRDSGITRVARALESGTIDLVPADPFKKVEYLIFELADGDVRTHLDSFSELDLLFTFNVLHHVSAGLRQLHGASIAHQDLKPSNVLIFDGVESKIGDLGRAWTADLASPCDGLVIPGDTGYAPPEMLYGQVSPDATTRRYGCDMYHLGSIVVFLFSRTHMTALITKHLPPLYRSTFWSGTYADVLPYVQTAFADSLAEFGSAVPEVVRGEVVDIVKLLCEPDPSRRGHPNGRVALAGPTAMERFVTRFNLLAYRVETGLLKDN